MHIGTKHLGTFMGITITEPTRVLRFNKNEIKALDRAASIAEQARLLVEVDSDLDLDLAQAEHGCRNLIAQELTLE